MQLEIGPMCPTLQQQLKGVKIDKARVAVLERDHRELSRLYVRGYLNESAFTRAGRELMKRIEGYIANKALSDLPQNQ